MPSIKKCLVLLSGGVDSAVLLWWAKNKGWKLSTLSFYFPGRRKKEIQATRKLRKLARSSENYEIELPFVSPPESKKGCYIPKRNLMYYSIAASIAEKIDAGVILGGHYQHDGVVFPDAHKNYLKQVEKLIRSSGQSKKSIRLIFPFIDSDKKSIIKKGHLFKVPFIHTWSCSIDRKGHCWRCNSCRERIDGFVAAGVKDPLLRKG